MGTQGISQRIVNCLSVSSREALCPEFNPSSGLVGIQFSINWTAHRTSFLTTCNCIYIQSWWRVVILKFRIYFISSKQCCSFVLIYNTFPFLRLIPIIIVGYVLNRALNSLSQYPEKVRYKAIGVEMNVVEICMKLVALGATQRKG